jgi:sigma-E factor negative regulatory protein RseA
MSEKLKEAVSAAVDDEADEFELRRVLDEVHKDAGLKLAWERYHLVGAVLREERLTPDRGLRERVWAELEFSAETDKSVVLPEPAEPVADAPASRLNRLTGLAVAASVALAVVLVGWNFTSTPDSAPAVVAVQDSSPGFVEAEVSAGNATITQAMVTDQDQTRLTALMLAHAQNRGMSQPGLAAFTKMVTYQRR